MRAVLITLVVMICGALAGWYFYVQSKQSQLAQTDAARGLNENSMTTFGDGSHISPSGIPGSGGESGPLGQSVENAAQDSSPLWQIEKSPVAGFGFTTSSTTPSVEYVARMSGYLIRADLNAKKSDRITANRIAKPYEALVARDGSVIIRSINDGGAITTFLGSTTSATSSSSTAPQTILSGFYIASAIRHLSLDPFTKNITYSIDSASAETITSAAWGGKKPKNIFSSAIKNWRVSALGDGRTFVTVAPSDGVAGYAYQIKQSGLSPVTQGPGLILLPQDGGGALLWSTSLGGNASLFVRTTSAATSTQLSINTVAEKCVWMRSKAAIVYCAVPQSSGRFGALDDWLAGLIHTKDAWWRIDTSTGITEQVYKPRADISLDVRDPQIDDSGNYIVFINNADDSLWSLRIAQ